MNRAIGAAWVFAMAAAAACSSSSTPSGDGSPATGDDGGASDVGTGSQPPQADSGVTPPQGNDAGGPDAALVSDGAPLINPDDGGTPAAFPAPAHGALFGAFVGAIPETQTDAESEALFTGAEALINRRWVIDNRFYDNKTDWTGARTQWDIANHKIPLVTWMPYGDTSDPLAEILAGTHDAAITAQAKGAKALGAQILMRWGHEMNGNWYPWSGALSGGQGDGGASSGPAKYVAAWRHVHDLFVQAGATNVIWVWCPLVTDVPSDSWNHWTNYYPGDNYVDWVGLDAYNWGSSSSCCVWQSFSDLVDAPYQDYAAKKPIMLPETASAEVGGDKAAWIDAMHHGLETTYPAIHAVVWFDINKETDWRINSSPGTLGAYRSMGLDSYFAP